MTASPDPAQFAASRAGALLDTLESQARRTLKTPEETEVHDLRVAIRRFGQVLTVFEPCFGAGVVKQIHRKLDAVISLAGEVRDSDIVVKMLGDLEPPPVKIMAKIERKRAKAEVALTDALGRLIDRGEPAQWRSKLMPTGRKPQADAIREGANRAILRATERFFKRGEKAWDSKDSGKKLHRLRIAAKELRYTFELAHSNGAAHAGQKNDNGGGELKDLQSDLGDIHDLGTVREILWKYHGSKKLLDPILRKERTQIREFRQVWKNGFLGAKHRNQWMGRATRVAESLVNGQSKPPAKSSGPRPQAAKLSA